MIKIKLLFGVNLFTVDFFVSDEPNIPIVITNSLFKFLLERPYPHKITMGRNFLS